jgi:hypothetical protein
LTALVAVMDQLSIMDVAGAQGVIQRCEHQAGVGAGGGGPE